MNEEEEDEEKYVCYTRAILLGRRASLLPWEIYLQFPRLLRCHRCCRAWAFQLGWMSFWCRFNAGRIGLKQKELFACRLSLNDVVVFTPPKNIGRAEPTVFCTEKIFLIASPVQLLERGRLLVLWKTYIFRVFFSYAWQTIKKFWKRYEFYLAHISLVSLQDTRGAFEVGYESGLRDVRVERLPVIFGYFGRCKKLIFFFFSKYSGDAGKNK